jgi:hypothetical protein
MKASGILFVATMAVWGLAQADEHPACRDLDFPYASLSSGELRVIARSCAKEEIASLYYRRARHAELLDEGEVLSGLIPYSRREQSSHFDTYRIYIAFLEAFAAVWYPDAGARAAFLNKEYDRLGEVAELRLRGYDNLADRLERGTSSN